MKIGIDASRANRLRKTGTEWYSYYLIKNLAQLDSKNEYILYVDKPVTDGLLDLCSKKNNKNNKIEFDKKGYQKIKSPYNNFKVKILKWPFNNFWTLGRLTLEMIFKAPDILFVPSHTLPLVSPKKTINTIHDVAFAREKNIYWYSTLGPESRLYKKIVNNFIRIITFNKYSADSYDYLDWSTRFALKRAKEIIAVSDFTKKEILDIYGDYEKKIKVVYNGYNSSLYGKIDNKEKIKEVLNKYGIEEPYLFYVGRLEKKKNTPFLIDAYALLKEYNKEIKEKLVLAGNASFGYDEVEYTIREYGLEDDVVVTGWVDEEDMPYLYNGASAFVFPSKHEGFGIPLLQAMACEAPIVCSDIPVLKEIAEDSAFYFNPNKREDLADKIKIILKDDKKRREYIEKGKKRVRNFSWEKCAKDTLDVLNEIK
jgi:glycosyltransferase involved in cell wall biosynthesis